MNQLHYWNIVVSMTSELMDIVPVLLMIFLRVRIANKYLLIWYLVSSFSIKLLTIFLIYFTPYTRTLPYYHLLAVLEFVFLFLFYLRLLERPKYSGWGLMGLVVALNVLNTIYLQDLNQFNSYAWTLNSLVLIIMGFLYLVHLYDKEDNVSIISQPNFIINAALMIYLAGSLFTYLLGWYILNQKAVGFFANGWIIHALSSIFKNLIICWAVWQARNR